MADDFEPGFALGGADGPDVFLEGADLDDAVVEAGAVYPRHTPLLFDGDLHTVIDEGGEEFEPNLAPESMPELAHRQSGLYNGGRPFSADGRPFSADEVMAVSLRDAHARLRPFFRHYSADGQPGDLVAAYKTPLLMTRRFMTANAKLVKGTRLPHTRIKPGLSRGPNLLPHRLTAELSPTKRLPVARRRLNFCVGSTPACRATCLLYSGQNPLADKQTPAKLSRSEALITDPAAWLRMFVAAIAWHVDWCVNPSVRTHDDLSTLFGRKPDWPKDARTKRFVPYVRPNVLSDIPFEMIFPDLFELFPRLSFYDYTKVPARTSPHGNYDLTFSFSGTKQNRRNVAFELRRERRIAVVFWL